MPHPEIDRTFMKRALRLAARGGAWTAPNPMVGAVVVKDGRIVGEGYHRRVGDLHAEPNALADAGEAARGATLYVTLEPCNHFGRTPPCSHAVLEAGVRRVVIGMLDPNTGVKGGGAEFLRSQGVEVESGVLERECRLLNQAFIKHSTTGLPLVVLKAAATLDGRIAARSRQPEAVSNERSHRFVHRLRCDLASILVGIGTALADDPSLTARPGGRQRCRQPVRIVLDSGLRLPLKSQLVRTAREVDVIAACAEDAPTETERALTDAGVQVLRLSAAGTGVDLAALLRELGVRGINSILVEGGGRVHGSFLRAGLADEFYFFYAPKLLADDQAVPMASGMTCERMAGALRAHDLTVRRLDDDVLIHGRFREEIY